MPTMFRDAVTIICSRKKVRHVLACTPLIVYVRFQSCHVYLTKTDDQDVFTVHLFCSNVLDPGLGHDGRRPLRRGHPRRQPSVKKQPCCQLM